MEIEVSASRASELDGLMRTLDVPTYDVATFNHDKSSWLGKASAVLCVARLPWIAR